MSEITFKGITVHYKNRIALSEVSGQFGFNRIVGLTGANGSGKSTMLNSLMGEVEMTSGEIKIDGVKRKDLKSYPNVFPQLVSQEFQLDRDMRANSFVFFCAEMAGINRRRIKSELLRIGDAFGWSELGGLPIRKLSGGQKQRVHLIASWLAQPNILLLDEPFQGLDAKHVKKLLDAIADVVSMKGRLVVICSHRIDLLESVVDDVCLLHRGELLYCGGISEIPVAETGTFLEVKLGEFSTHQWRALSLDLKAVDASLPTVRAKAQRFRFVTKKSDSVRSVLRKWMEAGLVKSVSEYPPGLEMKLQLIVDSYERDA